MRARWRLSVAWILGVAAIAVAGEPKPNPVDIKKFRDKLVVLEDPQGGKYVVLPDGRDGRVWFGTGKTLYEQIIVTRSMQGDTVFDMGVWTPIMSGVSPGSILRKEDGSYHRWCSDKDTPLALVTADRAKGILDKSSFVTSAVIRSPHVLARDDSGVYYYVDRIRKDYGGGGYRVFVGKKGAMKELPLSDIADDSAGQVFSTKTGDMRFVSATTDEKASAVWVKGEKRSPLTVLNVDLNARLIHKDLGIYGYLGTICDDT